MNIQIFKNTNLQKYEKKWSHTFFFRTFPPPNPPTRHSRLGIDVLINALMQV